MKKTVFAVLIILLLMPLLTYSQNNIDVFAKTVPIVKVLTHKLGYKVYYMKENMDLAFIYVPLSWISEAGGKGEVIWGNTDEFPYMSVIWRDGAFYQVKLYLQTNPFHESWGVLEASFDAVREKFNIEEPAFEF